LSKKSSHKISFLVPLEYLDAMDSLVEKGLYQDRGEVIRDALRHLSREKGIDMLSLEAEKPVK